jgi:hypothetical protein
MSQGKLAQKPAKYAEFGFKTGDWRVANVYSSLAIRTSPPP